MTFPKIFLVTSLVLFGAIGVAALFKKTKSANAEAVASTPQAVPIEIALTPVKGTAAVQKAPQPTAQPTTQSITQPVAPSEQLPEASIVELLFQKNSVLPIVETIQYRSQVPWKRSRSAWLVDYAGHYKTHLHFIARSLNGKCDYTPKAAREGEHFNILSPTENFYFYLLVDISRCKMWFHYVRPDHNERVLLKTYRVGLGRVDSTRTSGSLTPTGTYKLGTRVAVFQPKMMGMHKGQKVELIRVFGTRWIPFEKEIGPCSEPAKGYGIHGTPWHTPDASATLVEDSSSIGRYESDGCIRMACQDVEELFSIIATHDTTIEIVSDYNQAALPGRAKNF